MSRECQHEIRKKTNISREKKVWRIFRFKERYELRDDVKSFRKSGLMFTRNFVSDASGDEAAGYFQQLNMLQNGDGEKYHLFEGIYNRLVREAAKRSRAYRGYLLNADDQPLSILDLARILKINSKRMISVMRKFEQVGLLEQVPMPDRWDLSLNENPSKKDGDTKNTDQKPKKHSHSKKAGKNPEKSGNSGNPLKKEKNNGNDNDNPEPQINKRQTADRQQSVLVEGQDKTETTLTPTTTPRPASSRPIEPQGSDAAGSVIPFPGPSRSAKDHRHQPQAIGDILGSIQHRYNPDAQSFGIEIYRALGLRWLQGSRQYNREVNELASMWLLAERSGLPLPVLSELWDSAIIEAERIRKHAKARRPGALFSDIFKQKLAKRLRCKAM